MSTHNIINYVLVETYENVSTFWLKNILSVAI